MYCFYRLQSELHLIDAANTTQNTHKFFLDSKREMKNFDLAKRLDTDERLLGRRTNRPRISKLEEMQLPNVNEEVLKIFLLFVNHLCKFKSAV